MLEGLEAVEIKKSELNSDTRFDSEYFSKSNIVLFSQLKRNKTLQISEIANVTDGIHTSIDYDDNSNVNLISATSPRENVFNLSREVFISEIAHKQNPRTALKENDVIISTVGTIGNCAVVDKTILPANSDRHVGIIRIKTDYSPYFLSTFLLSKYGRMQTIRESTGNVQLNLFIYKLKELVIPQFESNFQHQIEQTVKSAHAALQQSKTLYAEAEEILLDELGLKDWQPKNENISIKTFSNIAENGRLDAEYYQPKYYEMFALLSKFECDTIVRIANIKKSIEPGSEAYQDAGIPFLRVSNITKFGLSDPDIYLSPAAFDLEKLKPTKDTILLSKDGSVGIAYKVEEDLDCITSGALLHLSVFNKNYLPDYLTLVLNSIIVKLQAERDASGAIIQHWKPSEIEQVVIPKLPLPIQQQISAKIQESFRLKAESKRLLEEAKAAVESEIEK